MVIHNQKPNKIILALRRGLIKVNLLYDPDLFLNNRLSGFRPRRSGVPFSKNYIKLSRLVRVIGFTTSASLLLLTLLSVFPIVKNSDTAEATVTPATTTLTMTSSSTTASVDVTPTSSNGTFATSAAADEVAFTVTTNNVTGYNLTIAGSDNTRQLNNTDASATLDSITAATDQATFTTGAAATYSNKWGYKPSMYNSVANTDYLQAPTTTAETLNQTTSANTTADTYTIGLGARVDYTKPVGTYTNTFVIEAVANNVAYQINYLDNSGATVTGLPAAEGSQVATASAFTLDTSTPTRTGYTFQGWCYGTADYTTNPTGCTGTTYQAGDNFVFTSYSSTSTNTANLYAMWKADSYTLRINFADSNISSVQVRTAWSTGGTLKGTVSSSGGYVSGLAQGTTYYLYPTYSTNYGISSWSASAGTLSSTTLNNPSFRLYSGTTATVTITSKSCTSTAPTSSTYMQSYTANLCEGISGSLKDRRDDQVYTVAKINGMLWMTRNLAIGCTGTTAYGGARVARSLNSTYSNVSSAWSTSSAGALTDGNSYDTPRMQCDSTYGAWYNYAATTAGTITGSSNTSAQTYDICPKGWRLPTNSEQSGITSYSSAYYPVTGGRYSNGSLRDTGYGYWWSSTSYTASSRYSLWSGSSLNTGYYPRYGGFYVRCIRSS
ncbi:hypothetical protein IJI86_02970 [Candidatus Saccharibacteria bacterium]|nr:hypothetical protein [Candidatus Saccharibacteria bacterium]